MPQVPIYNTNPLNIDTRTPNKQGKIKKSWKTMNREVKPREREILQQMELLQQEVRRLRARRKEIGTQTKRLQDELEEVRATSSFGKNTVKLYALRLQDDCWYIGMTFDVERRFKKHLKGKGATWTRLHKPIEIAETRSTKFYSQDDVARLEDDMTIEYVLRYGSDYVRGGGYCQTKPRWPSIVLQHESVY